MPRERAHVIYLNRSQKIGSYERICCWKSPSMIYVGNETLPDRILDALELEKAWIQSCLYRLPSLKVPEIFVDRTLRNRITLASFEGLLRQMVTPEKLRISTHADVFSAMQANDIPPAAAHVPFVISTTKHPLVAFLWIPHFIPYSKTSAFRLRYARVALLGLRTKFVFFHRPRSRRRDVFFCALVRRKNTAAPL